MTSSPPQVFLRVSMATCHTSAQIVSQRWQPSNLSSSSCESCDSVFLAAAGREPKHQKGNVSSLQWHYVAHQVYDRDTDDESRRSTRCSRVHWQVPLASATLPPL